MNTFGRYIVPNLWTYGPAETRISHGWPRRCYKIVLEGPFWLRAKQMKSQCQHQWIATCFADSFFRSSYWYMTGRGVSVQKIQRTEFMKQCTIVRNKSNAKKKSRETKG